MFETGDWSEGDVVAVLANPIYAVPIDPEICSRERPTLWGEDEWIEANASLIELLGADLWLRFLLNVLRTPELCGAHERPIGARPGAKDLELGVQINPATAIVVHPRFTVPHPRDTSEAKWIQTNALLIEDELGAEPYLRNLLAILRGAALREDGNFFGYADAGAGLDITHP